MRCTGLRKAVVELPRTFSVCDDESNAIEFEKWTRRVRMDGNPMLRTMVGSYVPMAADRNRVFGVVGMKVTLAADPADAKPDGGEMVRFERNTESTGH